MFLSGDKNCCLHWASDKLRPEKETNCRTLLAANRTITICLEQVHLRKERGGAFIVCHLCRGTSFYALTYLTSILFGTSHIFIFSFCERADKILKSRSFPDLWNDWSRSIIDSIAVPLFTKLRREPCLVYNSRNL